MCAWLTVGSLCLEGKPTRPARFPLQSPPDGQTLPIGYAQLCLLIKLMSFFFPLRLTLLVTLLTSFGN